MLTVSLVTLNGERFLEDCFRSLLRQNFSNFQVVVLDNGSSDSSLEIIEKYKDIFLKKDIPFLWRSLKKNIGFAKAHNIAIKLSSSKYILVLNQDVVLGENYFQENLSFLERNPQVGAVMGRIYRLTEQGKTKVVDSLGLELKKTFQAVDRKSGKTDNYPAEKEAEEIWGVNGTASFYRKEALEDVGYKGEYFDEDFFSYKEDVDLALRLRKKGWKSFLLNSVQAWHWRSARPQKSFFLRRSQRSELINYHSLKNHLFFLVKNLTVKDFLLNFPFIVGYEAGKFFYVLFLEPKNLLAYKEFFVKVPKMIKKRK